MDYFFDSHAIIEILEGNDKFQSFSENIFFTTTLNLSEVYYYLLRQNDRKTADFFIKKIDFYFLEINSDIAIDAARFRREYNKEGLSFVDCLGYICALRNNLIFLTGDSDFKNKDNVEFIE